MKYTLNQLEIFLKIVQTRSITKAAEELFLSQPAVSIQLKNFQDHFDVPLTEVVGRKLFVTDFGLEIAEAAERIIQQVEAIDSRSLAFKGQLTGKLKVSVVSTGKYILPYFITTFMREHPGIDWLIDVTNKSKVLESLERNEVDFALVSILPTTLNIERLDLIKNKLFLVGNVQAKIKAGTKTRELFSTLPLIYREEGSGTRQIMEGFIARNKISVVKKMELTSNEAVKQALLADLGYSIMPLLGIRNELLSKELQIIPVKGLPIITTWSLIWLKGKKFSPVAQAFLQYVRKEKSGIIHDKFSWYEQY